MRIPRPLLFSLTAIATGVFADTEFAESEPLIKRVDHWEGPMFEQLSADTTGIDFTFSWDPPEYYRRHFSHGSREVSGSAGRSGVRRVRAWKPKGTSMR